MVLHRSVWRAPNPPPSSVEMTLNLHLKGTYGKAFYFNLYPVPLPCPYASLKCLPPHSGWELAQGSHRSFPISLLVRSYLLLPFHVPLCTPAPPYHATRVVLPEDAIFVLLHLVQQMGQEAPCILFLAKMPPFQLRIQKMSAALFSRIMRFSLYPQLQ